MSSIKAQIYDYFLKRSRYGLTEFFLKILYVFVCIIFGWFIILPISLLIPRRGKYIIFIGREKGYFIDNVKYLFLKFLKSDVKEYKPIFITEDKQEYIKLKELSINVVIYPSYEAIKLLLTCPIVVVDHDLWVFKLRFFLLYYAKKIQLWHGAGFKYIGILKIKKEIQNPILRLGLISLYRLIGLIPFYDIFISTSEFYTKEVFKKSFKAKSFIEAGYPRNDVIFRDIEEIFEEKLYFLNTDVEIIQKSIQHKKEGGKIILYAPTFRDSGGDPLNDRIINIEGLNEFCKKHAILFIIKFHPDPHFKYPEIKYSNVLSYNFKYDIYPLFSILDILITDYSAIYTDFLLTKKPIIFFPYDFHKYIKDDRAIQFDYKIITPGVKCFTQNELYKEIIGILFKGKDMYMDKRREILNQTFKYPDGKSSDRIINILLKQLEL